MSEQREEMTDDLGSYSVDDEDQLQPEETLEYLDSGKKAPDPLDRGYSPPDTDRSSELWGTTAYEQAHEETIDQRIAQEIPDPDSAYGAPDNESGLDTERVGGDDPDAIDPDDDWYGEPEAAEPEAQVDISDQPGDVSAEESAVRVVEE
jgi:hypothetical protein